MMDEKLTANCAQRIAVHASGIDLVRGLRQIGGKEAPLFLLHSDMRAFGPIEETQKGSLMPCFTCLAALVPRQGRGVRTTISSENAEDRRLMASQLFKGCDLPPCHA
jgi:aminoglycoside N3'-acetyltransferase